MASAIGILYGQTPAPKSKARSSVKVRNFGRVLSADLEMAPLTVLLGKNNSGKSYLATLLWGLRGYFWNPSRSIIHAPKKFRDSVNIANTRSNPHLVEASDCLRVINNWLARDKDKIIQAIFNCDSLNIGELKIDMDGHVFVRTQTQLPEWFSQAEFIKNSSVWSISFDSKPVSANSPSMITSSAGTAEDRLFLHVVEELFLGKETIGSSRPVYIPAARTGLVLALRDLIKGALSSFGRSRLDAKDNPTFTMPVVQFLRTIVDNADRPLKSTAKIADFLISAVLGGQLHVDPNDVASVQYQPQGSDTRLPMHVVSSMVTELTPIITVLRSTNVSGGLVIEEPEAHLHLSAQRSMARAIARLVNTGVPVVVTTHSDTFVQQLNILIQLQDKSQQFAAELGYEGVDLINREDVCAYELVASPGGSICRACEITEHGIVAPSLNETIIELTDELLRASAE